MLVVEESFLCRRVVATVQGMAQRDGEARAVMHRLVAVPTDTSWEGAYPPPPPRGPAPLRVWRREAAVQGHERCVSSTPRGAQS